MNTCTQLPLTAGFRWKVTTTTPTPSGGSTNQHSGSMVAAGGGIAAAVVAVIGRPLPTISETTTQFTTVSSTHTSPEKSVGNGVEPDLPTADISMVYAQQSSSSYKPSIITRKKTQSSKAQTESKRERKAAKTLAIITGERKFYVNLRKLSLKLKANSLFKNSFCF